LLSIGFKAENITFVPISAFQGINLIDKVSNPLELTSWYKQATLLELLDNFKCPRRGVSKPLRVCVYDFYKAMEGNLMGDCVQCKVESGIIKEKDEVILMPFNIPVGIKAIEIFKKRVNYAFPGTICELVINLPTSFDPSYIKAGNVMCDPKYPVHQVKEFRS